jgi:hypothetical protein
MHVVAGDRISDHGICLHLPCGRRTNTSTSTGTSTGAIVGISTGHLRSEALRDGVQRPV